MAIELNVEQSVIEIVVAETIIERSVPTPIDISDSLQLTKSHDGRRMFNAGATETIVATLPPSAGIDVGWKIGFRVSTENTFRILASGDDVMRFDSSDVASFESSSIGSVLDLEYAGSGRFIVSAHPIGPWTTS